MAQISSLMSVGRRSMMNSQTGLHTVGHNIANKETEGYSRQRTETHSNLAMGEGKVRIGMGARAATVERTNNPYLEKQIGHERSELATAQGRQQGLSRLEGIYNEQTVEGFNKSLGEFFNAFRELATNPESMPRRTAVKAAAEALTNDFHNMNTQLNDVNKDINSQLAISVNELNSYSTEIATLNKQIQEVEIGGGYANDERDRRDLLLKKLGEVVDIKWTEGDDSSVTVSTASDALLVVGSTASHLDAVASPAREGKGEGDFDIIYYHNDYAQPITLSDRIQGGRLGGLLSVRSGELQTLKNDMDRLAYTITTEVNQAHGQGYNAYNQTGVMFFDPLNDPQGAAEFMKVNTQIASDSARVAVGRDPHKPGDNRVALQIAELQYAKPVFGGSQSIDEFYNGLVGELGIKNQAINRQVDVKSNIVSQLNNLRESISGVSLDEEAAKMIEMQKHFDAAARLIRTADEIMETVINIKRY